MIILWGYQYLNATRRFDNKGYYEVLTAYFKVEPVDVAGAENLIIDEENTERFTNNISSKLRNIVRSINEDRLNPEGEFVEFYANTVVANENPIQFFIGSQLLLTERKVYTHEQQLNNPQPDKGL